MLFNSYIFWLFFLIVAGLYKVLGHRGQNVMLLIASYVFYAYWDWRFLFLILFSTSLDYFAAIWISKLTKHRGYVLAGSIVIQTGFLGLFKYYNFFAHQLADVTNLLGLPVSVPFLEIVLPVGISFYTFQTMSYTIDVYRGEFKATRNFVDFALFVSFFPHMIAGPIVRAAKLLPQIANPRIKRDEDFREGLYYVLFGLFKKVVIADNLAAIADTVFNTPVGQLSGLEVVAGIYAFAFQIYCDFSGYSSMAQGLAKWLHIDLTVNFRNPYFADSPSDFWRRWHISLSSWFRDYVYIPLARHSKSDRAIFYAKNVMLVMLLSGLWHGAAWTFVLWGAYHGLLLCFHRFALRARFPFFGSQPEEGNEKRFDVGRILRIVLTFHLICVGWVLFRSASVSQAFEMLAHIPPDLRMTDLASAFFSTILFYAGPLIIYEIWLERKSDLLQLTRVTWAARGLAYCYAALMLVYFPPPISNVFIYFQF